MSTGDGPCPARSRERGFTFLEVSFVLAIVVLLSMVIERTIAATQEADRFLGAVRRATERGEKTGYEVLNEVSASRKLFQGDSTGNDYLDALDLSRAPLLSSSRLPIFDETGELGPDVSGDPHTGNVLLFAREGSPVSCVADPGEKKIRFVDMYRFVCVYASETTRQLVSDDGPARDLVLWQSIPYPSYSEIMGIEDVTERRNVAADLCSRLGHDLAWDPNAAVEDAFYTLDALGAIAVLPESTPVIDEDPDASGMGRFVYAGLQLARTSASSYRRRAVFTRDDPADWVPDGFEIKVVGASGSRKVWLHLIVERQAMKGRVAVHDSTLIASARDL